MIAILFVLYIIPTIVAAWRMHPQFWPIVIVNVLLGWTFVGWVAALAWACFSTRRS